MRRARHALALLFALLLLACGAPARAPRTDGPPPQANRLAVVDAQGDVFTITPDGADRRRLTSLGAPDGPGSRSVHFWPTWSPDGRWVAAARAQLVDDEPTSLVLYALPAAGGEARQLFGGEDTLPFFYSWSPDARSLAVLSQTQAGLALHVAPFEGTPRHAASAKGSLYLAWSGDGHLAAHVDGSNDRNGSAVVKLYRPDGSSLDLTQRPNAFRAPVFARDGSAVYMGALDSGDRSLLLAAPVDGGRARVLAQTYVPAQFVLSPEGERIALARESSLVPGLLDDLQVIDTGSAAATPWHDEPVLAFFWSPDGARLAWIGLDGSSRELALYVGDGPGGKRKLLAFSPTRSFLQTLAYFDQYATTTAIWSPDSRSLQIAGWLDPGLSGPSQIWIVSADGSTSPYALADGTLASWSPLAK